MDFTKIYSLNELGIQSYQNGDFKSAFSYWMEAANLGYREAKYHLANLYYYGEGCNVDLEKAVSLFKEVAESEGKEKDADIANSRFNLANAYYKGEGIKEDEEQAIYWYEKAAELNHPASCFNLGTLYFSGEIGDQDFERAYKYLIIAANSGISRAQYMIGVLYIAGRGCNQDLNEAKKWLEKAASNGDSDAKEVLNELPELEKNINDVDDYYDPMELDDLDINEMNNLSNTIDDYDISLDDLSLEDYSIEELEKEILNNNRKAEFLYAMKLLDDDGEKAVEYLSLSASKGYPKAMHILGMCYVNGLVVDENEKLGLSYIAKAAKKNDIEALCYIANYYEEHGDYSKMANVYHKLADELNYDYAFSNLGNFYLLGSKLGQDYNKAFYYLNKAYERGIKDTTSTGLGLLYFMGNGVEKNISKAVEMFEVSDEQNEPMGIYYLGQLYEVGKGVEKDISKAKKYYKKAADLGFEYAEERLKELE